MLRFVTIPRDQGIEDGLAARIHDPLWMLARQWQLGEFRGEDAASPSHIDVRGESHLVDRWRPGGSGDWLPYDRVKEPLERLVEQEPSAGPDARLRLEGGLRLRRLLEDRDVGDLIAAFATKLPFEADEPIPAPAGGSLAAAVRSRLPDGARLEQPLSRLVAADTRDAAGDELGIPAPSRADAAAAAADWLAWWRARAAATEGGVHPAAWDENRLEYAFQARASSVPESQLDASEYAGGRLDWWAVDIAKADGPPGGRAGETVPIAARGVPGPARYGGMPAQRFWEMEDAQFDLGSIDAAPNDLGRMLMVAFATSYGNDWFVVPIRLPVGSLSRIDTFTLTDVFGRTFTLDEAGKQDDGWNLFGLTDAGQDREPGEERATAPWFLLSPALPESLESPPVESVLLLRDEMANLAWAVEAEVSDDAANVIDRFGQWAGRPRRELPPATAPQYRVQSEVPYHWYPLAPEQLDNHEAIRLRLVPLERGDDAADAKPLGLLLRSARSDEPGSLWLREEEVPRSGAAVIRTHQLARWHDGSIRAWTGRRKRTGGGEGSSGLRFDYVEPQR
jgi:hypothetical protein